MFSPLKNIIKPKNINIRKIFEKNVKLNEKQLFEKNDLNAITPFNYCDMYLASGCVLGSGIGSVICFKKINQVHYYEKNHNNGLDFEKYLELYFGTSFGLIIGGCVGLICFSTAPLTFPVFSILYMFKNHI